MDADRGPLARIDAAFWYRVALIAVLAARWATGLPPHIEVPYWYLSYQDSGFVRRALVGSFTEPFIVGRPSSDAIRIISIVCVLANLGLIALLTALLTAPRSREGFVIVAAFFAASNALPFLAHDLGFLDVFIVSAAIGAALLIAGDRWLGLLLCALVPLIHEGGLFLVLPMLGALAILRPGCWRLAAAGAVSALIPAVALWFFATSVAWPAGIPIEPEDLRAFAAWPLGQRSVPFALPLVTTQVILWSVLPCLAMAGWVGRRVGRRAAAIVLLATAATWSITLITIDWERFWAWGPFTAAAVSAMAFSTERRGDA